MFADVRIPWFFLLLMAMALALQQYEFFGHLSPQVAFMVLATWLYANACSKGEECIIPTWDMMNEKWGFLLIFWNMAGVPFAYSASLQYLARHGPSTYGLVYWLQHSVLCTAAGLLLRV